MMEMIKHSPFEEPKITALKWSITSFRLFLAFSPLRSSLRNVSSKKQSKITSIWLWLECSLWSTETNKWIVMFSSSFFSSYIICLHRPTQLHNRKHIKYKQHSTIQIKCFYGSLNPIATDWSKLSGPLHKPKR